ncbi:flavodoxin domain-containing protein [Anaerostipes sp.]|uniref:flavodoxin domain-containing protein n=1 Tax=Anaerostipes sp. TaxID=1872530 RepID=UPI0025BC0490|nr:flavodoxin domain-containing protein [Anaerostipes sp.]MBS7007485.1 flavodoxin [Anaerostipes sp.]
MKKAAVVYGSVYGSTKEYAQWIAETLSADLYENKNLDVSVLEPYDVIIYGGGLYAGGVSGISLISRHPDLIQNKKVFVFTCGIADPGNPENTEHILKNLDSVFSPDLKQQISFYHLRGRMDYKLLSKKHRVMMWMMKKMLLKKKPEERTEEDQGVLDTYGSLVDFTDRDSILPLTADAESFL